MNAPDPPPQQTAPPQQNPYAGPPAGQQPQQQYVAPHDGDSTGGVIPYKNPHALIAYYLGLFSLFPLLGLFLGIAAFILGIIGLKKRKQNPAIKGSVHAWIGIVLGGLFTLIWGMSLVSIIVGIAMNA